MTFWTGYSMAARNITGIRAEWTEPDVSGVARSAEYIWVGIGSWDVRPVVQAGTYVGFRDAHHEYRGSWYERYPLDPRGLTGYLDEFPGDTIAASITMQPGSGHRWRMTVRDVTTGLHPWSTTVTYKITHNDADFIVEDPAMPDGRLAPFSHWGMVPFSKMEVRIGHHWLPAGALRSLRISMIRHHTTWATAGPLGPAGTSFTATQH